MLSDGTRQHSRGINHCLKVIKTDLQRLFSFNLINQHLNYNNKQKLKYVSKTQLTAQTVLLLNLTLTFVRHSTILLPYKITYCLTSWLSMQTLESKTVLDFYNRACLGSRKYEEYRFSILLLNLTCVCLPLTLNSLESVQYGRNDDEQKHCLSFCLSLPAT